MNWTGLLRKTMLVCLLPALLMPSGCTKSEPADGEVHRLSNGRKIVVLSTTDTKTANSAPALMLKYQTTLKIDDVPGLEKESDEIWTKFQEQVNDRALSAAIISPNDPPSGFIIKHNSSYYFLYTKGPDGQWHRTDSDKKP